LCEHNRLKAESGWKRRSGRRPMIASDELILPPD